MSSVQLEFVFEDNEEDVKLAYLQQQIDAMNESMGKVRRKLFSQIGEMQKALAMVQQENVELRRLLLEVRNEKQEWAYEKGDHLFDVQGYKKSEH